VLWICGSAAAAAFAWTFARSACRSQRLLAITAAIVALLGALMILADYFGQSWAGITHPAMYFVAMTSYRAAIAWVLWQYASSLPKPPDIAPQVRASPAT
jgi:uncharacterized membrane protein YadS